jgi:hypothetical protein
MGGNRFVLARQTSEEQPNHCHKDDYRSNMSDERLFELVAAWLWCSSASTRLTDNHHGYVNEFGLYCNVSFG